MFPRNKLAAAILAGLLALGCEPPDEPSPGPEGSAETGGGDPGGSGGDAGGSTDGADTGSGGTGGEDKGGGDAGGVGDPAPVDPGATAVVLSVEPRRLPREASAMGLEIVGLALFVDAEPVYRDADTPCDGEGRGALLPLETAVSFTEGNLERRAVASFDHAAGGALTEIWLVLRQGTVHAGDRVYKVHAGAMCVMPDGLQYALVRLRPRAAIALVGGSGIQLVVQLDGREQIVAERVDCRTADAEECRDPDDAHDDDDDDTRVRYAFARQFPLRVETVPQ